MRGVSAEWRDDDCGGALTDGRKSTRLDGGDKTKKLFQALLRSLELRGDQKKKDAARCRRLDKLEIKRLGRRSLRRPIGASGRGGVFFDGQGVGVQAPSRHVGLPAWKGGGGGSGQSQWTQWACCVVWELLRTAI
jgi:hypothetical protein